MSKKHFSSLAAVCSLGLVLSCFANLAMAANTGKATPVSSNAIGSSDSTLDYIVAVVNSEPISYTQLTQAMAYAKVQMSQENQAFPTDTKLTEMVLNQLIDNNLQLQVAKKMGITVDDAAVKSALSDMAQHQSVTVDAIYAQAKQEGFSKFELEKRVHNQMVETRLRARELDPAIKISSEEVSSFISKQDASYQVTHPSLLNLALISLPISVDATQVQLDNEKNIAQAVYEKLMAGRSFLSVAKDINGPQAGQATGLQPESQFPSQVVQSVRDLTDGAISPVIATPNAFYIAQVVSRQKAQSNGWAPQMVLVHARHILLRVGDGLTEQQAMAKLKKWRQEIVTGKANFADLAKKYSQDQVSGASGGDLGWLPPSTFVPKFVQALSQLQPGQISKPVVTQFGVHLIELMGERQERLSGDALNRWVAQYLKQQKYASAYQDWVAQLRQNAYIDIRPAP